MEWIGAVAFAISGALVAIRREMDLLGVVMLGLVTAVGGGMLRDVLLGITPPSVFFEPSQAILALLTALVVFTVARSGRWPHTRHGLWERLFFICDTLGLAAFTMAGMNKALLMAQGLGIAAVMGVLTGVGGGVFRDVLAGERPSIFVRHVYASACMAGALAGVILWPWAGEAVAVPAGAAVVLLMRILAARFRWNLPRIASEAHSGRSSEGGSKDV